LSYPLILETDFCFLVFFIPEASNRDHENSERHKLKSLIEKYGGMLSEYHECFTYQIEPITETLTPKHYFPGDVFQAKWLVDSVKEGVLLNKEEYLSYNNQIDGCKRIGFGKK